MATISIEEKVVVIEDPKKAAEIQIALNSASTAFLNVKPTVTDTKDKEQIRKLLSR